MTAAAQGAKAPPIEKATRDALIERGLVVVRVLAFRMVRRLTPNVQVDDLISAGIEGLVRAVDRFDASRGRPFEAYVEPRIRGAILDELRNADAVTRHGRRRLREVTRAVAQIEQRNGRAAEAEEIATVLGIPLEAYWSLMANFVGAPLLSDDDVAPDAPARDSDPGVLFAERELRAALLRVVARLPERTQKILALYYQEECTLAEIGRILGVTESRICQILGEALTRLRAALTEAN